MTLSAFENNEVFLKKPTFFQHPELTGGHVWSTLGHQWEKLGADYSEFTP